MTIEVTIDLDKIYVGEDGQTAGDQVLAMAASQLLEQLGRDEALSNLRAKASNIRDEMIRERFAPLLETALDAAVQRTDAFGQTKGEPTTFREVVVEQIQKFLTEKRYDNRVGHTSQRTAVQEFIEESVDRVVKRELTAEITEAREQVAAAVRDQGAAVIQETIARLAAKP
ncbi:hypothetical protein LCGC14_0391230 [marine sediment metagenome]|uniref:Uncharacterized protein n=1 Tax=marine sediment metagenome TaxID=412755 RepID=A0A0F9THF4_9ZZZZ